jgi:hypothetical protein
VLIESRLRRPMMVIRIDRLVSGNHGALAGDVLCLATIAFIFAIVFGIVP